MRDEGREGWQSIYGFFLSRHLQEQIALLGRDLEMFCQQIGDLARGTALVRFDFEDQRYRTAQLRCQILLCKVECFAPALNPISKGSFHGP